MKRNSSIELLRIFCVFMIIFLHYAIKANMADCGYRSIQGGIVFIQCMSMFGRLACSIFVLITGYYSILINISYKAVLTKNLQLILKLSIYSGCIYCINTVIKMVSLNSQENLRAIVPFYHENWFITYYIIFAMLMPLFNKMLNYLSRHQYKVLCVVSFIFWSVIPTLTLNAIEFSNLDFFLFFYLIGGYIRKYEIDCILGKKIWMSALIISFAFLMISVVAFDFVGIWLKQDIFIAKATWFRNFNTVPAVVLAISLFVLFNQKKIYVPLINIVAESALGIYILHDNIIVRKFIWEIVSPNKQYVMNPYLHMIGKSIAVFLICFLIDFMFNRLFSNYIKIFSIFLANKFMGLSSLLRTKSKIN